MKGLRKKVEFNIEDILSESKPLSVKDRVLTLTNFFELFGDFKREKKLAGLADRTLSDYDTHFKYLEDYLFTIQRFKRDRYVDSTLFNEYLAYLVLQKQYSPFTVNIRLRTLRTFLKWLYTNGHMEQDLSTKIKLVKVPQDTVKPLSDNQVRKLLSVIDTTIYAGLRDYTLAVLFLDTGIRVGEAVQLRIEDLDNGTIKVRGEVAKTRNYRIIPISKRTSKLLVELSKISKANGEDSLFLSSVTGTTVDKLVIIKNFEKYGKKAGVEIRCTPHVFRHTFARNAVRKGIDVFTLQKILGHSDISTTRKYIQLDTNDLVESFNKIDLLKDVLQ